jgi:uncharacterized damage-inducible protein DinB
MSTWTLGRPEPSEYAPYAATYVNLVPATDFLDTFPRQLEGTMALLKPLNDQAASFSYAPGKWTIKDVVGHVCDTERIFAARILRVARQDATPLPGYEQDDYVRAAGSGNRPWADLLAELQSVRQATLSLFRGLPHEAWLYRGVVNGFDSTPRGMAFLVAGHELHHARILREKYGLEKK